ncbi:MAG TPA: MG2 domain-containing protein [Abditibacterium sp.]
MKTLKKSVFRFPFAILCALSLATPSQAQIPMDLTFQANKAFSEKSYGRALELYRAAKAKGNTAETEKIDFRIVESLFKTEKWDEAIESAQFALKSAQWKARFHYLLGQIYVKAPKSGYRLGDKTWRQNEYPEVKGDQKPQRASFYGEDQKAALEHLETAKVEAQRERAKAILAKFSGPIYPLSSEEEIDLNFDLAGFLSQNQFDEFWTSLSGRKDEKFDETIDAKANYSRGWSLPKKVATLYAEIRFLAQNDDKGDASRSLLADGLFIRAYKQRMDSWANQYDNEQRKVVKRRYPFDEWRETTPWRNLVSAFPNSPLAPQALLLIAQTQGQTDLVKSAATWRELIRTYPKSKWVSDARAALTNIEAKELSFNLQEPTRPGQKPKLGVGTRNLKSVDFAVYRVKLEDFLTQKANLNNPNVSFTQFTENFGKISDATKKLGAPLAKWRFKTADKSDYRGAIGQVVAPFSEIGAYVVVAQGAKTRFAQVVIISDLALLKKSDKKSAFVFVADAKSGAAIQGANVVLKETYGGSDSINVAQGKSNDGGFFEKTRSFAHYSQIAAFSWIGNRYAITGQQGGYYYGDNGNLGESRVLGTTDRPVYRPGQKVSFRQVITSRKTGGEWQPLIGAPVVVVANNPKGEKIFSQEFQTNEFGSVSGEFTLPHGAPLGEYNLQVRAKIDKPELSFPQITQFRVEEYKRPEFEVTITAPHEAKRPGETVAARIGAKYYFGAPVPGAKVKYTVRKSSWWASYGFPTRYDWLYASWGAGNYDTGRRNIGGEGSGQIVKEGTVTLDELGFAELSFKTDAIGGVPGDWWSRYSNPLYTIEAEVTDASRRTIEAQGAVKVARQPYFAFLNIERGYFQNGDRIPVEIRTQDANEQSVAASGKMVVYKLTRTSVMTGSGPITMEPEGFATKIHEEAISIDASGRAFWNYEAKESGQFRIEYQAKGEWGEEIKAQVETFVVDENMSAIRLRGVTILLDKKSYEEGDTLKAAIIADQPGANVLLTQEASGEILRRDVVRIDGKSKQIEIPIDKKHVPNFFLAAALVQDFEVYQAQTEVFVPPTRQLLQLEVKGDKASYKPGETGTFEVSARDWSGKPARAEVSLALVDASLFYIQKDYAPEIKSFYYGDRRQNTVNLDSSRSGNPEARGESDEKILEYETHNWELPDDFGQLQLMPGGGYYYGYNEGKMLGGGGGAAMPQTRMSRRANLEMDGAVASSSMPAPAMSMAEPMAAKRGAAAGAVAPVQVRSNFAETAYWSPSVITENGKATVKVTFPDSLTQWHASARGLTQNVQVGAAETDVATKKDLLVRLQAPRFFVERDQVVISANVHNYSDKTQSVTVNLEKDSMLDSNMYWSEADQKLINGIASDGRVPLFRWNLELKAGEEKRVDWPLEVKSSGQTAIQVTARTKTDSDAVKMSFPVLVHGVQRFAGQSGVLSGNETAKISLNFPKERKTGASELNLQLNPSLAAQMLDALPYLAYYPYGCVEQTMSRFLPTVITARTLRESGVNLETLRARAKAYEAEAKTPALGERVKNTGYTYPTGAPNSRDLEQMASKLWFRGRGKNPIFDQNEIDKMTRDGLSRLYAMQRGDGGWGWWPGSGSSDEYMSAYVVYGLYQAKNAGVAVRDDVLQRGANYLKSQMKDEDDLQLLTYIAYSLSQNPDFQKVGARRNIEDWEKVAAGRLFEQRERLAPLSKAYLAMALNNAPHLEKAKILVENLENTIQIDAKNGTARFKTGREYWHWWNNDVETVALALRAFNQIEPTNKLVPMMVKWLTLQARGNHYRSTKETAEVVYTLADYVVKNRGLDVDYTLKVGLNGKVARTYRVNKDNALFFDNRFIAGDLFLENGANALTIEKTGKGKLYWNAYSEYFSLEEPIKASGNELEVERKFFKLTRLQRDDSPERLEKLKGVPNRALAIRPPTGDITRPLDEFLRTEIKDGENVKSGDLIEVELVVNAKNDYEYLIFEDMKAAGFEPVEIRSGQSYGDGLSSNVELRDEKVAFFVDRLPQGRRVLRYRVRAEVPGTFHALPTNGYAMYAPEVRAISDEMRVSVKD